MIFLSPGKSFGVSTQQITMAAASSGVMNKNTTQTTSTGTIAAGAYMVVIKNIGGFTGTIDGKDLPAQETLQLSSYMDSTTNTLKYIPATAYDATATEFLIVELRP